MEKDKIIELQNKIIEGLKMASVKLLESKKKNKGKLVVYSEGEIKIIDASEIEP